MFVLYLIIGSFSGILAGLVGIGGGIIVVPALAVVFTYFNIIPADYVMQMAIGTSLATIILTLLSSLRAHAKRGSVRWNVVQILLPGLIVGTIVGSLVAHRLPSTALRFIFSTFLFFIAYRLFFVNTNDDQASLPTKSTTIIVSGFIGALSGILGTGGGTMLIPFFLRSRMDMHEAAGTSVACGACIGVVATVSFMLLGMSAFHLPFSTGYIYWPAFIGISAASILFAPIGTLISYKLPASILKRILAVFLVLIAVDMLFPA